MSAYLSITQAKIWLFHVKTQPSVYSPLCMNLVREICLYLTCHHLLPCIQDSVFRLHDFESGHVITSGVPISYSKGASFCLYTPEFVLCVGDAQPSGVTYDLNVKSYRMDRLGDLQEARQWVGVVSYGLYVYVFGGNINPSIRSVEKFDTRRKGWLPVPSMIHERCCFTPTEYFGLIYLIEPCARNYPIEAFSPAAETYRTCGVSFKAYSYGVISFVDKDSIVILQFAGKVHRWKVGAAELETAKLKWQDQDFAVSVCPPIRVETAVYWISYRSKRLVKYEIQGGNASVGRL